MLTAWITALTTKIKKKIMKGAKNKYAAKASRVRSRIWNRRGIALDPTCSFTVAARAVDIFELPQLDDRRLGTHTIVHVQFHTVWQILEKLSQRSRSFLRLRKKGTGQLDNS